MVSLHPFTLDLFLPNLRPSDDQRIRSIPIDAFSQHMFLVPFAVLEYSFRRLEDIYLFISYKSMPLTDPNFVLEPSGSEFTSSFLTLLLVISAE